LAAPATGSTDVALVACEDYERARVEAAVGRALELLGGVEEVVSPGQSVFLKVNALLAASPERHASTHPEVVRAIITALQGTAGSITVGDCPGGPASASRLRRVYEKCGFARVAEETGAVLNYDCAEVQVPLPEGVRLKSVTLSRAMVEADRLVSLSKLKTHVFMKVTAAIKNTYGTVPGMNKFSYHSVHSLDTDFADLVVDVCLASKPSFHLVDAIWGMEGDGAVWGDPRRFGFVAAGLDPFAVDAVMADLIGVDRRYNMPLAAAIDRGLAGPPPRTLGDDPGRLSVTDLKLPSKKGAIPYLPGFVLGAYERWMTLRPWPDPGACTGCGMCAEICPGSAISMRDNVARVDLKKCVRCYCCYELCEHGALKLKKGLLTRARGR